MLFHTIQEILAHTEKKYGPKDAIRYKVNKDTVETKSYTELKEDSERFSALLCKFGKTGKHIAITGRTSYEWITAYLGTVNSGSVAVPLDFSLPAEEMCELIDRSDASVLVLDEMRKDVAMLLKEKCPKLEAVISMQKKENEEEMYSFWQCLSEQETGFKCSIDPDSLCTIMFTSGTTGKSKGVMLSQRNIAENATCLDIKIPERTVILMSR
ncbi:MAG: long-chain fatty acid--CoA ligase, partial [Roseburia sp.]|nr:long-chain fatty acid--CoA ligase [Roseburia sp.]